MSRYSTLSLVLFLFCFVYVDSARPQDAKPGSPLTCHKTVCPQPTSSCQMLESNKCVKGECPGFVNVVDGTTCNDNNACTTNDVCTGGACMGTPVVCSSPTDVCNPSTGNCATPCGPSGCTVGAANGFLNPTITIPAGALNGSVSITMVDQGSDPSDPTVFHVYSFGPTGTAFSTPATLNLPAPPLTPGQSAVIEISDDNVTWTPIPTTLNNGRVSGNISHFSSCHTRAFTPTANAALIVVDMIDYQSATNSAGGLPIPPPGDTGSCNPTSALFGLCFKVKNPMNGTTFTQANVNIALWQCYDGNLLGSPYPGPFDPTNPAAYEGQHCSSIQDGNLLIPCQAVTQTITFPGGLAPGASTWIDINFSDGDGLQGCLGSSLIGADVLFREPTGGDPQGGMRSAIQGPFIDVNGISLTWEQLIGCTATLTPYLTCPQANYPLLKQNTATGVWIKNWLTQTAM